MKKMVVFALSLVFCGMIFGQAEDDNFEIKNIAFDKLALTRYLGRAEEVRIPEKLYDIRVTVIDNWAFWFKNLTKVTFPPDSGIHSIGNGAFAENKLAAVTIPRGVRSIGYRAFRNNLISTVTFPEGLVSLGEGAFEENQITGVTIPRGLRSIGDWAFFKNKISHLEIAGTVRSIGKSAFAHNQLTAIELPDSLRLIGDDAFSDNNLKSVSIGNDVAISVNSIDDGYFFRCYNEKGRKAGMYTKNEKSKQWSLAYPRTVKTRKPSRRSGL